MPRYIDAEVLKQLRDDVISGKLDIKTEGDLIDVCPTADVVEVVHGEWVKSKWGYPDRTLTCSECGEGIDKKPAFPYCPRCGAKMKGGEG